MTYRWNDPDGDSLYVLTDTRNDGTPVLALHSTDSADSVTIHVPLDRVEELVTGIRDTARQTAREGAQP